MQTDKALNVLEAFIVLTGKPEMTLAQACVILRALQFNVSILPTLDAKSPAKSPAQEGVKEPVKSRFFTVGKKPGPKPGKKKLGRPRKVAQE